MTPPRLEFDYIATPYHPRWLGYALLVLSLAIAASIVVRYHEVRVELGAMEAARDLVSARRPATKAISKERLDEQVKNVEAVVRQLTLPWATLIQTLEEASIPDVAILQLQPEAQQRVLRISAEARHKEAMFEYVRKLAAAKALSNVHLLSHQVQTDDPQRPIQFAVQASFRGPL